LENFVQSWSAPLRPNEHAERSIIQAILNGDFPPGEVLPGERDLAALLGVTRPTLRETLHRLGRDGWVNIRQGKPTMVNDIWRDGGLNVLSGLIQYGDGFSTTFIKNLLWVRLDMAPSYTRLAVENSPQTVIAQLQNAIYLEESPEAFARFDWDLHYCLTIASGNPIYTLILNGFFEFYIEIASDYFSDQEPRKISLDFYSDLLDAVQKRDGLLAYQITKKVMRKSIDFIRE
jgi:GntR family negative regulator for fad regulon and positive regulator of fabA